MMKLRLDGSKISEDVRMIELKVIQDRRARAVMDELGALVAEGGVVLVGLDDEERRIVEPRRNAETLRHAADQEARIQAGLFQYPGQQRRRRRLAVGAGNAQHPATAQDVFGQPLRTGHVGQVAVEDLLEQRIAARNGVADHEQVGVRAPICSAP